MASQLKLSKDGSMILWPQPEDDPNDPQNVCVGVLVQINETHDSYDVSGVIGARRCTCSSSLWPLVFPTLTRQSVGSGPYSPRFIAPLC